ncbi:nesprin-1-like isoform X2 [Pomacea canaliculata]|uniref:nesprin-1-like isoform X2 n=1 Tax=Pomacea canaliculata TaxID=400727 RepID=UPI000D735584|nr:nesprin-1-like isoform X2 [Pomacea canaliculata]
MEQLVDALKDASEHLDEAEQQLQDYSPSVTDSTSNFNQHLIACEGLINTIQHLDRVLKIETGAINIPSADLQIARVFERWEQLQSLASESDQRLSQQQHELVKFHTDVEALLAWMDEAEALQSTHSHIPSDITDLNIVIRQHKDFMVQLEAKKAHVLSVRLLSKNFVNTTPEGRQLRTRLKELDQRWEALTASAARTQQALQGALLKCEEFHHTVHDYLVWMERMEERLQRCEPVRLSPDHSVLWSKYMTLKELQRELEANQGEVLTLRETAEQLLVSGESPEMAAARDKTRIIANRLRTLLHLTSSYIESLETKLGVKSSSVDAREVRQPAAVHRTVRTRTRSPFAVLRRLNYRI